MVLFINFISNGCRVFDLEKAHQYSGKEIKDQIAESEGLPSDSFILLYNGRVVDCESKLPFDQGDCLLHCHVRLPGGKGGFGSMLRAIGAQIEKTTNREACRDLSGRRMRDVNDEKKIAEWLSKQSDREKERAQQKQARLEKLMAAPRHVFEDSTTYTSQLQENIESVDDALEKGLKSSSRSTSISSLGKRKADDKMATKSRSKKRKIWLGVDDEDMNSDSDEESDIRSSCSSVVSNDGLGYEASSGTSSAMGRISDTESCGSEISESCQKHASTKAEEANDTTAYTTSLLSTSPDSYINGKKCTGKLENTEESETRDETDKPTPNVVAENNRQLNNEESKPSCSVSLPLDLERYTSKEELEALGLDILKSALLALGLKCGGTLQQRAERLFSTKGIPRDKLAPSLLAKPSIKKQRDKKEN